MEKLDLIYFKFISNLSNNLENSTRDAGEEIPDLTPLVNYFLGYGGALLTGLMGLLTLFFIFNVVKIRIRISKCSADGDYEGRSQALREIIWQIVGALCCFFAGVGAGILTGIFMSK
ncbi:hypothetical protein [Spiroplasma diminutum]|uniref:Transmembrane protein n=1 Tax=Spiroplasma diminutum CUAS-1 TaxID=1276221 RepID=S5M026_9MOLU|nr:hypothetical protein [Spiroplasma diminutum]AGR42186.1 hypothetical protein SDIMI_v3c04820 [Spiroplasma diminutum CUAS-1]